MALVERSRWLWKYFGFVLLKSLFVRLRLPLGRFFVSTFWDWGLGVLLGLEYQIESDLRFEHSCFASLC